MKRLGGAVALALVVAGCGDSGLTEGAEGGDVTVTNHPALLYSPPWIAAQDQKLFAKNGLEVKQIVGSEGGGTTVRNVVSGGLPIGEVATTAAVSAFMAGADIRIVGGGVASSRDTFWVTRPDEPLDSIEDLKGKTVGYTSPGSVTQGLLALSLERSGVGLDNVETRTMGGLTEGLTALKTGDIDAAAILEPVFSEQAEEEWKIVFKASDYVPEFLSTVIISGPGVLEEDRSLVQKTIQARADGIEFLKRDPDAVAEAWAKEAEIEPESARKALDLVDPAEHWVVGLDSPEALQTVEEEMRLIDLLPGGQRIDWDELVVQDFIPPDQRIQLPGG
ncbi:ABC transporter substrate-binding protein [Solirubrobacter phytolaccae]|uniref:ABC transporter substrate-binding protein n=1 Tax=Solirubrobacter phytolaccae TaxID=1404360 RepID=A0A9X3NAV2_9ACTN|nr:ABC transporter substrate-binding protein [Solirubrobacter phytolaccae]MDA0182729.1 ABC transporter substrate-binding protein [Solirubrobacter phytolaccae]